MEKFFSVVVELESKVRQIVAVKGQSAGEAFGRAKVMPGVNRVGKVSEVSEADFEDVTHGRVARPPAERPTPSARREPEGRGRSDRAGQSAGGEEAPRATAEFAAVGPRVVLDNRTRTGERPFKNLQAPPPRPTPPPAPTPAAKVPSRPAKPTVSVPPEAEPTDGAEYRIVKSRRRDGKPYLLQRGKWAEMPDAKGKRAFQVEWEQGFDDREAAEQHPR